MIIYLNPAVNNHTGRKKLKKIHDALNLRAKSMGEAIIVKDIPKDPTNSIYRQIDRGERVFIAGGGDGTVHSLANAMMQLPENIRHRVYFGALGLGSSNDFHKPIEKSRVIKGIPIRVDFEHAQRHNVAEAVFLTNTGQCLHEYFIVNGSLGATAEINHLFNTCNKASGWLKSQWTCGCIYCCGLSVFLNYKNIDAVLELQGGIYPTKISNLGFLIYPNFAGNFKYDTDVSFQSDYFCVNLSENMTKGEQFRSTMALLIRHKFSGRPKTHCWKTDRVSVSADIPMAFEMDGEVRMVKHLTISLIKGGLTVCR